MAESTKSRQLHRLTALRISKLLEPGYYRDGGGLHFQISPSGARSWIFRFTLFGRTREMGLGSLASVSLAAARTEAAKCRALLKEKIDPIEARNTEQRRRALESACARTFKVAAEDYIAQHRGAWKNAKHAQQWTNTLATYAYKVIADVDVRDIDTPLIVRILQPIWTAKRETAARVRGRIESILDAEKALGHREGENPARWRGHLDKILPRQNKRKKVKHHPALPWADIPTFMPKLLASGARSARMLHLLILTCVRTNEVLLARPEEFDLERKVWTIPGDRMKMERPLRVPLSQKAVEIVREAKKTAAHGYLFPGTRRGRPFSNMTMLNLLDDLGYEHITVHGFRSTFRDWVAECTEYPDSLAEKALAHAIENETEAAYRRGDMLERRRKLMEDWARYCSRQSATVTPITQPAAQDPSAA